MENDLDSDLFIATATDAAVQDSIQEFRKNRSYNRPGHHDRRLPEGRNPRALLLFAFILLPDHLARHLLVVGENQPRDLGEILVDLAELLFDFLLVRRGQRALEHFEIVDVLVHLHLRAIN